MKHTIRTDLFGALACLGGILGVTFKLLLSYAKEDNYGGTPDWPEGSIRGMEGRLIYATVRLLKPKMILEAGTGHGCATTHLTAALRANGSGILHSIDIQPRIRIPKLPEDLENWYTFYCANARTKVAELAKQLGGIDVLFEDSEHKAGCTRTVLRDTLPHLRPGGVIMVHDTETPQWRKTVPLEMAEVLGDYVSIMIEPELGGIGVWKKAK